MCKIEETHIWSTTIEQQKLKKDFRQSFLWFTNWIIKDKKNFVGAFDDALSNR